MFILNLDLGYQIYEIQVIRIIRIYYIFLDKFCFEVENFI